MFQLVHTFVWLDRDVCGLTRRRGRTRGRESARRSRRGVVARRRSRVRDPDYDSAGWGTQSASVSYTQIIPVLVKSNQELHERIVHLERALEIQQQHDAQIADLEAAVASRDQQIDELRGELSDIVSRLEAVET